MLCCKSCDEKAWPDHCDVATAINEYGISEFHIYWSPKPICIGRKIINTPYPIKGLLIYDADQLLGHTSDIEPADNNINNATGPNIPGNPGLSETQLPPRVAPSTARRSAPPPTQASVYPPATLFHIDYVLRHEIKELCELIVAYPEKYVPLWMAYELPPCFKDVSGKQILRNRKLGLPTYRAALGDLGGFYDLNDDDEEGEA